MKIIKRVLYSTQLRFQVFLFLVHVLRWLEIVSSPYILLGRYNHSLTLDATIMVSKNCPTIDEHIVIIFVTFKVALNPMYRIFLNFAKSCVLSCSYQMLII